MARFNNKKLQAQRNFQSIWHSHPEYIGKLLKEDQLIREYIIGTMKAKEWKLSEIIIKRKVKQIHIAFQIQNKLIKERKKWTKNRLKNRLKYRNKLKKRVQGRRTNIKKRYLFFQLFLMATELRKMYPNNIITFYIQKTKPLQFNANLVSSWIMANMNKKKSYKRLLNRVIRKYKKGAEKTKPSFKTINSTWNNLKKKTKKNFLTWFSGNLIYLYNTHNLIKPIETKSHLDKYSTKNLPAIKKTHRYKKSQFYEFWLNVKREIRRIKRKKKYNNTGIKFVKKNISKKIFFENQIKFYDSKLDPIDRETFVKNVEEEIKNISKQDKIKSQNIFSLNINKKEIKPQKNYLKNISKRNIYTLVNSPFNINNQVIPSLNSVFRRLSTNIEDINSQSFNSLNINQTYFIFSPNFKGTKNICVQQILNRKNLKIQDSTFRKFLFYYLTMLKFAFLLKKRTSSNLIEQVTEISKKDKFNINQDLRTTWKLTRKLPRIQRRLGKVRRYLWKQHRNEFNNDLSLLLDYYKYRNSINTSVNTSQRDNNIDFIWQGKNFIQFLKSHPPLLDHVINCLNSIPIYKSASAYSSFNRVDPLIAFLTDVWTGFFDYTSHFENSLSKWQGIKIMLKGRIGFKKMGRAKKYSHSWGVCKNSSASLPLQYKYSQIHTRYGAVSMRIFIR